MRTVWAVIRREYLQRVRSKWFLFATVGVPALVMATMLGPIWFSSRGESRDNQVVILDDSQVLGTAVAERLREAGLTVELSDFNESEHGLMEKVLAGDIGGYLVLDDQTLVDGHARWVSQDPPAPVRRLVIRQAVAQSVLERRLGGGTQTDVLLHGGQLDVQTTGGTGGGMDDPVFAVAYIGSFILYMVVLIYAVAVMRSVLEEKTSRIVEVVLASVRPWQLMLGKILGVGAVGLTQLAVWVAAGVLMASLGIPSLLAARPELGQLSQLQQYLPGLAYLGYFLVFFLGGYFMYSALYAAVGAMCNSDEEAQQAQLPVMMLLVVPVVFLVGVIQSPNSALSTALSLFPLFSPVLMFARAAAHAAPWWQIALSIALMTATVPLIAWVAGRIYRVGILMTGKRPTLPELWRWMRES